MHSCLQLLAVLCLLFAPLTGSAQTVSTLTLSPANVLGGSLTTATVKVTAYPVASSLYTTVSAKVGNQAAVNATLGVEKASASTLSAYADTYVQAGTNANIGRTTSRRAQTD